MSDELKKEAKKQYFHYFRIWFLAVGILLAVILVLGGIRILKSAVPRANGNAPAERVYDYADLLTAEEEEKLRSYIAKKEARYGVDFVIMTFSQPVEGKEALDYGCYSTDWETNMTDLADAFWEENHYGYNKDFEGDGSILIDNRYPGQRGEWLSTSGKVEAELGTAQVEEVLYAVDDYYDSNPYKAYKSYIDKVCDYLDHKVFTGIELGSAYYLPALIISVIVAWIYAAVHLKGNRAGKTVAPNAYVVGGKPVVGVQQDDFIRKDLVKRHIETSSGGGGGSRSSGRSSGGGGHHVSRGGASHGGGGHRH